jgi:hypothetical protein
LLRSWKIFFPCHVYKVVLSVQSPIRILFKHWTNITNISTNRFGPGWLRTRRQVTWWLTR